MTKIELGLGLQTPESDSIKSLLENIDSDEAEGFRAAFAYVTTGGVEHLKSGLSNSLESTTPQWLVSFDYGYTQPEAVRLLDEIGSVRVVGAKSLKKRDSLNANPRFHPKFVWIQEAESHHLMMGSANLTESALTRNWESVMFLRSIDSDHPAIGQIASWWEETWDESHPVTDELLDWYEDIRESSDVSPDTESEEYDDWEVATHPRNASIVWGRLGYTQGGSKNQMDIPTKFGPYFLEEDDTWELNSEYKLTFRFEGEKLERKIKYHDGSHQARIYLPTETRGTRLEELFSSDKFDKSSLRYYFAVFRRIGKYDYKLKILPPEDGSDIERMIEYSQESGQIAKTDKETDRLVGWL